MKKLLIYILIVFLCFNILCINSSKEKTKKTYKPRNVIQKVEVNAKDNFIIHGTLYYYKSKPAIKRPLVIMLHSLGGCQNDFKPLIDLFISSNYNVLTIDMRGHGLSIKNSNNITRTWQYFPKSTFLKYPTDIADYYKTLFAKYNKYINENKLVFIGGDIGANTAILTAYELKLQPKAFVLLSPTLNFKGLYIPIKLTSLKSNIMAVSSLNDRHSMKGIQDVNKYAQNEYLIKLYPKGSNGVSLIYSNPALKNDILNFVKLHTN